MLRCSIAHDLNKSDTCKLWQYIMTDFPAPAITIREVLIKGETFAGTKETTRMCCICPASELWRSDEPSPCPLCCNFLLRFMRCSKISRREPLTDLVLTFFLGKVSSRFGIMTRYVHQHDCVGGYVSPAVRAKLNVCLYLPIFESFSWVSLLSNGHFICSFF